MYKFIFLAIVAFGALKAYENFGHTVEPLYSKSYVAVYGRDSCGYTQKMLADLRASRVNYRYFKVDNNKVANTLHTRMEASGISTQHYNLPVVDVNGRISVRPNSGDVLDKYKAKL